MKQHLTAESLGLLAAGAAWRAGPPLARSAPPLPGAEVAKDLGDEHSMYVYSPNELSGRRFVQEHQEITLYLRVNVLCLVHKIANRNIERFAISP